METERAFDSESWRAEVGERAAKGLKGENHVGDLGERMSRVAGRAYRGLYESRRQASWSEWKTRHGKWSPWLGEKEVTR